MSHVDEQQAVTLINVFAVEPDNQQALVDLLVRATDDVMSKQAGYLSARIHRSFDGRKVAVYARRRSTDDFMALTVGSGDCTFLPDVKAHTGVRVRSEREPVVLHRAPGVGRHPPAIVPG